MSLLVGGDHAEKRLVGASVPNQGPLLARLPIDGLRGGTTQFRPAGAPVKDYEL